MVSKLIYSTRKVNPFSGVIFAIRSIGKKRIYDLIDIHLGSRAKQAVYSYADIILGWSFCNLCGAERLEDISNLQYYFKNVPTLKLPSPDSVGIILRALATKTIEITSKNNINHQYSIHMVLNRLMLDIALKLDLLNTKNLYVVDYDNVVIGNKKWDSRQTYLRITGYQPGVCFIGRIPVYIEGRNGNSTATHDMHLTLARSFDLLEEKNIHTSVFRSDSAAFQAKVLQLVEDRGIKYYIRGRDNSKLYADLHYGTKWNKITIAGEQFEAVSIERGMAKYTGKFRLVVYRYMTKDEYRYWTIATNDWGKSEEQIVHFYNQRGTIEQNFDILKNDFNWRRLPFSFLNENTVFMIISAISCIIYHYLVRNYSKKVDFVKRRFRLKNFIYHFIILASVWENGALKLFTDRDYTPLIEDG